MAVDEGGGVWQLSWGNQCVVALTVSAVDEGAAGQNVRACNAWQGILLSPPMVCNVPAALLAPAGASPAQLQQRWASPQPSP